METLELKIAKVERLREIPEKSIEIDANNDEFNRQNAEFARFPKNIKKLDVDEFLLKC